MTSPGAPRRRSLEGTGRLLAALALFGVSCSTIPSNVIDPQADPTVLIGTWAGEWRTKFGAGISNQYSLTIHRVSPIYAHNMAADSRVVYAVSGVVEYREYSGGPGASGPKGFRFQGTFAGNQLAFSDTMLVVEGPQMRGTWRTGLEVKLSKQK